MVKEALEDQFGEVTQIKEMQSEGKPLIYIFYFDGLPEQGFLTAVTCGLSDADYPDWKFGKPELIVTMESQDYSWGLAAGYFLRHSSVRSDSHMVMYLR